MIITDSLGAPRKESEVVHFNETWPCMLFEYMQTNYGYYNFVYTQKALHSTELRRMVNMNLDLYDSEFVFLQIGIVDCARRVFSEKALRAISFFPLIRNVVRSIARKYHYQLTKLYKVTFVKPDVFRHNIDFVLNKFSHSKWIFVLPIVPAGSAQSKKSYKIIEQIETYNTLLKEVSSMHSNSVFLKSIYQSFLPIVDDNYMADGYHINKKGHAIIFKHICNELLISAK